MYRQAMLLTRSQAGIARRTCARCGHPQLPETFHVNLIGKPMRMCHDCWEGLFALGATMPRTAECAAQLPLIQAAARAGLRRMGVIR